MMPKIGATPGALYKNPLTVPRYFVLQRIPNYHMTKPHDGFGMVPATVSLAGKSEILIGHVCTGEASQC
jgi:hypothetical protein